jgi:hypothetical protein
MLRKLSACLLAASTGILVAFSIPSTTLAQQLKCWPRDLIARNLERNAGETPAFQGVTAGGSLLEIFVGADGTFTVTFTQPDGLTCPFAVGENWRPVAPVAAGEPS